MSKNRISLDKINNMLGKQSERDGRQNWRNFESEDSEESGMSNVVFYSAMVGSCVALGFAAFVFFGSDASLPSFNPFSEREEFVSRADAQCKGLWQTGKINDEALRCIMVVEQTRFCDSREKVLIAASIEKYRKEGDAIYAKLNSAVMSDHFSQLKSAAKIAPTMFEAMRQMREAEKKPGGMTKEDRLRIQKMAEPGERYLMNVPDSFVDDPRQAQGDFVTKWKNANVKLAVTLRKLIEAGYLKSEDFGWSPDPIVKLALKGARDATSDPCAAE